MDRHSIASQDLNTMLRATPVPAFADNYIWLLGDGDGRRVAIVDPGEADPVLEVLDARGLDPAAILITHHHGDHVGGIRGLRQRYAIPVFGPAHESIPLADHPLLDGDPVQVSGTRLAFRVLEVPGHTRGHIAYLGHGAVFCGDTLFTAGCGRLFEGTAEQMFASLKRLAALPDTTQVYCAHEYTLDNLEFARVVEPDNPDVLGRWRSTQAARAERQPTVPATLGLEKLTNPFLRSEVPAIVRAAENFAGRRLQPGAEVFAVVRHWKDTRD